MGWVKQYWFPEIELSAKWYMSCLIKYILMPIKTYTVNLDG